MLYADAIVCILGIVSGVLVCCCCMCFCRKRNSSPASDPPPAGPVYVYDLTQTTAPDDSAPPPYHLASLYPPVELQQHVNPLLYRDVTFV